MTLSEIILKNLEWIILTLVGGVVTYTTIKIKLSNLSSSSEAMSIELEVLRAATRDTVEELKQKLEAQADVMHELRRKQDILEAELKYSKESIEKQLTVIEGYMVTIKGGNTNG